MPGSILSLFPALVSNLAQDLREYLLTELPEITEYPDASARVIGYGYGPGYKDMICTIILSQKGVKLGFYKGSELPDPEKLLTGSGKVHKYVEIKSSANIQQKALKDLLKEALRAYRERKK